MLKTLKQIKSQFKSDVKQLRKKLLDKKATLQDIQNLKTDVVFKILQAIIKK
jgi:hypothetical protein